jgi:hypothetical protein
MGEPVKLADGNGVGSFVDGGGGGLSAIGTDFVTTFARRVDDMDEPRIVRSLIRRSRTGR